MWSTFALSPDSTYVIRFPGVSIYIHADGVFWSIAVEYVSKHQRPASASPCRAVPENLSWSQSALLTAAELAVRPALAPRPYEVLIPQKTSIFPGVEIDGYIFIPLYAEICVEDGPVLLSVPLGSRKTSWFGSTQEGILCDAASSTFGASGEVGRFLAKPAPDVAVCPVTIKNNLTDSMELAQLCIPTDFLSVYGREGIFATDRVICSFSADGMQVKPRRGMDPLLGKMDIRHPARKGPETKFFLKSMDILRYLAGI